MSAVLRRATLGLAFLALGLPATAWAQPAEASPNAQTRTYPTRIVEVQSRDGLYTVISDAGSWHARLVSLDRESQGHLLRLGPGARAELTVAGGRLVRIRQPKAAPAATPTPPPVASADGRLTGIDKSTLFEDFAVGDTVALHLAGQLTRSEGVLTFLGPRDCRLARWDVDGWRTERFSFAELDGVEKKAITTRHRRPLGEGSLIIELERWRSAVIGVFTVKVRVRHDRADAILPGFDLRLRGRPRFAVSAPGGSEPIDVDVSPLVAGDVHGAHFRMPNSSAQDLEFSLSGLDPVPLESTPGREALCQAVASHWSTLRRRANPEDAHSLRTLLYACGRSADPGLIRLLISQVLVPEDGPRPLSEEELVACLTGAGPLAATEILSLLRLSDPEQELVRLEADGTIATRPLPAETTGVAHKRALVRLLARLPRSLRGEHGRVLFSLGNTYVPLLEEIEAVFRADPEAAVDALLDPAVPGHEATVDLAWSPGGLPPEVLADKARSFLERHAAGVLAPLHAELQRRGLSCPALDEALADASADPARAVEAALTLVGTAARDAWLAGLDQRVARAVELMEAGSWAEARGMLRGVLRERPDHRGAGRRLGEALLGESGALRRQGLPGEAAQRLEEALEFTPAAKGPLAALYLLGVRDDMAGVALRMSPQPAAAQVRDIAGEAGLTGVPLDRSRWVQLPEEGGFVHASCLERVGKRFRQPTGFSPRTLIEERLERIVELDPGLAEEAQAILGSWLARVATIHYEAGRHAEAVPYFDEAGRYVPLDPRLAMATENLIFAHLPAIVALGVLLLLGMVVLLALGTKHRRRSSSGGGWIMRFLPRRRRKGKRGRTRLSRVTVLIFKDETDQDS